MIRTEPVVIAVDTTGDVLSVAVSARGKIYRVRRRSSRPHDEMLLPAVERAMAKAKVAWKDLDAVAAAAGPGKFTGIRIGLSFAAVVGFQRKIPALALSRLEAAAEAWPQGRILAALTGWKNEVYHQRFRRTTRGLVSLGSASWTAAEDWPAVRAAAESQGWVVADGVVSAVQVLKTAQRRLAAKKFPPFEPFYLKPAGYEKSRH